MRRLLFFYYCNVDVETGLSELTWSGAGGVGSAVVALVSVSLVVPVAVVSVFVEPGSVVDALPLTTGATGVFELSRRFLSWSRVIQTSSRQSSCAFTVWTTSVPASLILHLPPEDAIDFTLMRAKPFMS